MGSSPFDCTNAVGKANGFCFSQHFVLSHYALAYEPIRVWLALIRLCKHALFATTLASLSTSPFDCTNAVEKANGFCFSWHFVLAHYAVTWEPIRVWLALIRLCKHALFAITLALFATTTRNQNKRLHLILMSKVGIAVCLWEKSHKQRMLLCKA